MSSSSKSKNTASNTNATDDQFVDVLYQKLGENWFAFSLIDDEMFMSPVSDDKIAEIKTDRTAVANIRPYTVENAAENENEAA